MPNARICAAAVLLVAGCGVAPAPVQKTEAPAPRAAEPATVKAAESPAAMPATPSTKAGTLPPKTTAPPPAAPPKPAAKAPVVTAKPAAPPPATAPTTAAAPAAARPSAPPLDLKSLEQRLKETSAIGFMTKLTLKNQVDDLLERFRNFHEGHRPPTLAELRPAFELLLMKVLSLVQDQDRALANDINASREAIWGVLADRDKLAQFL